MFVRMMIVVYLIVMFYCMMNLICFYVMMVFFYSDFRVGFWWQFYQFVQIVSLGEVQFCLVIVWQIFWQWDIIVMNMDQVVYLYINCFLQMMNFMVMVFGQSYVVLLVDFFVVVEFDGFKSCWIIF